MFFLLVASGRICGDSPLFSYQSKFLLSILRDTRGACSMHAKLLPKNLSPSPCWTALTAEKTSNTSGSYMFCGKKFLRELTFFTSAILRELISAIVKDWFSLVGINFCDFQEVAFNLNYVFGVLIFFNLTALMKSTNEQHEEMHNPVIGITLFHLAIALDINQQKTTIPLDAYSLILSLPER